MSTRSLLDVLGELVLHPVNRHVHAPPVDDKTNSKTPCIPFLPQSTRFLRDIVALDKEHFTALVNNYIAAWPPIDLSKQQESYFVIPHPKNIQFPPNFRADMDYFIYITAVLNATNGTLEFINDSATARNLGTADLEGKLLCGWPHTMWGIAHPRAPCLVKVEVVIVTMPAWCFTPKDMADFTSMGSYTNPASPLDETKMPTAAKLWARLHDFCYGHDSHYFIVATYEQWAFGCFSSFWGTGYVAPPMNFDAKAPTVIQAAMYWLDSAREHPQGYQIPETCEQPDYHEHPLRFNDWAVPQAQAAYLLTCCS